MTAPDPARAAAAARQARAAAAARLPDRIAFLGFGLIGGSIALALREAGSTAQLVAWTPGGAGPAEGLGRGILDEAAADLDVRFTADRLVLFQSLLGGGPARYEPLHESRLGS